MMTSSYPMLMFLIFFPCTEYGGWELHLLAMASGKHGLVVIEVSGALP